MRDVLHWLPLRQRIEFRVAVLVWYSIIGQVSAYFTDLCRPSLSARSTHHLRSAEQGLLHVPFKHKIWITSTSDNRTYHGSPSQCRQRQPPTSSAYWSNMTTDVTVILEIFRLLFNWIISVTTWK